MNAIEQQVTTALNGLGTTSRGIADTLANKGVRGYRNCADVCVLAVYLTEQFPGMTFGVSPFGMVEVWAGPTGLQLGRALFDQALMDLVRDFDEGKHPELEAS